MLFRTFACIAALGAGLGSIAVFVDDCAELGTASTETESRSRRPRRRDRNPPNIANPGQIPTFVPGPQAPSVVQPGPTPPTRFPSVPTQPGTGGRRISINSSDPSELEQINRTLDLIATNGPFPYRQDGVVFQNREGRLPPHEPGYYHEYTVFTPGASTRGTRRIITGSFPETWYTNDHYRSFTTIDPRRYP